MTTGRLRVNWDTCNTSSCGCVDREDPERTPDSVWECLVREFATTVYHPSGTAPRRGAAGVKNGMYGPRQWLAN